MATLDLGSIVLAADRDTALEQLCAGPAVRQATYLDGTPIYLVIGHDEIMTVLTDPRFSNDFKNQSKLNVATAVGLPENVAPYFLAALGAQDPPDHTRLRRLVAKEFTFRRVERLRPRIQEITDELLDALAEQDQTDLVESLAYPLPIRVICELLGVPMADQDRWRQWARGLGTPDLDVFAASATGLVGYILELIESKRREPGADLISALVADEELTTEELTSLSLSILLAGHETTVTMIAGGTLLLLTHPEQLATLRADPAGIPGAVEEFLRYGGAADFGVFRYTLEPVTLGGVTIPAGEPVMPVYFAGNRDPRHHTDPVRFRVDRADNTHLGFGHGTHFCLGAALARAELQIVFAALLSRFPDLALSSQTPPAWQPGMSRSLAGLPVRLRA